MCMMSFIELQKTSALSLSVLCNVYLLYKMATSPKIDSAFSALKGTLLLGRG